MRRQLILCSFTFLLISCSSTQWVKPGATPKDLEADRIACQDETLTGSVGGRGMLGAGAPSPRGRAESSSRAYAQAGLDIGKCLQEKGWSQEKVE